jgi:hypothetical protein
MVGELAIQIKGNSSDRGVDRIYDYLLRLGADGNLTFPILSHLASCLGSARPSPVHVRRLAQEALAYHDRYSGKYLLADVVRYGAAYETQIADEISAGVSTMIASHADSTRERGMRLVTDAAQLSGSSFWGHWSSNLMERYGEEIIAAAENNRGLRVAAVFGKILTVEQALMMPDKLNVLFAHGGPMPYAMLIFDKLQHGDQAAVTELRTVGRYLLEHPVPPWIDMGVDMPSYDRLEFLYPVTQMTDTHDMLVGLGLCAIAFISGELHDCPAAWPLQHPHSSKPLYHHITRQFFWRGSDMGREESGITREEFDIDLPPLPVPPEFQEIFADWTEARVGLAKWGNAG